MDASEAKLQAEPFKDRSGALRCARIWRGHSNLVSTRLARPYDVTTGDEQ